MPFAISPPAGQELDDDSVTVGDYDFRSTRQVLNFQLSPLDNNFTQLPEEWWPHWQLLSPEWLLSRQVTHMLSARMTHWLSVSRDSLVEHFA